MLRIMDAETQTSDTKFEQDQILGVTSDHKKLDAHNRRQKLRRSIYDGSETVEQRENRLTKQRELSKNKNCCRNSRCQAAARFPSTVG